jgi:hypothetical protein
VSTRSTLPESNRIKSPSLALFFHGAKREGTVTLAADGRFPPGNKLLK